MSQRSPLFMRGLLAALLVAGGAAMASAGSTNATLRVLISGFAGPTGTIMVGIHDSPRDFPSGPRVAEAAIPLPAEGSNGVARCAFILATGRYAMAVFHDANTNGKLDRDRIGRPLERSGFSRNASAVLGPPCFDAAAFELTNGVTEMVIRLQ